MKKKFSILLISLLFLIIPITAFHLNSDLSAPKNYEKPLLKIMSDAYADSVLQTLTLDEKIAQLIMLDVYPNKNESYYETIAQWVKEKKVGGLIFFKGEPAEITKLTNRFHSLAEIPLWVGIDGEWGISMRVDSITNLPKAITLGAITDNDIIRHYGQIVGQQCRRIGVNMNMAPVIDVNNEPDNPVINYRSFGENRVNVANKGLAYYFGMNDEGVLAVAKHFPGHGNTSADSHYELPVINDSKEVMDSIHLYPFKHLIKYGVPGIMTAHLHVKAYDDKKNVPSSLSKATIQDLLVEKMKYNGIIITDALGMRGVTDHFKPGEIEVNALIAGNDILLMPQNPDLAIQEIKKAVQKGHISESYIDEKCKKLLTLKYLYLNEKPEQQVISDIPKELNSYEVSEFIQTVFNNAVTLVKNENQTLPVKQDDKVAIVSIGKISKTNFYNSFNEYLPSDFFSTSSTPVEMEINQTIAKVKDHKTVIATVYNMSDSPRKNYGISKQTLKLLDKIAEDNKLILVLFGNPYALRELENHKNYDVIVVGYEDIKQSEIAVANALAGKQAFKGKLPVSTEFFKEGAGIVTDKQLGLGYISLDSITVNKKYLSKIDSVVNNAIQNKAFPGCQVVLAQNGKIFYEKAFGYHTYDSIKKVELTDIYDLSSLTKILATTLSIMKLFDEGKIMLDDKLGAHLSWVKGAGIASLKISEILLHQAGFNAWIPFYQELIDNKELRNKLFSNSPLTTQYFIIDNLNYLHSSYRDTIMKRIIESPLLRKRYRYSDLGFYLLKEMVEEITGMSFEEYLKTAFYKRMGLTRIVFNPLRYFSKDEIPPTEDDKVFRGQLVHGYVHDPGAAMLGGVSGHAGLFGNAYSVAVIMQLFLDKGEYDSERYLSASVVDKFTAKQIYNNRRGLGFDKPAGKGEGNAAALASSLSYGHTGFTGTFAWADPENDLIVVFLSNRIYPDASNIKISKLDVRKLVQEYAYNAVK